MSGLKLEHLFDVGAHRVFEVPELTLWCSPVRVVVNMEKGPGCKTGLRRTEVLRRVGARYDRSHRTRWIVPGWRVFRPRNATQAAIRRVARKATAEALGENYRVTNVVFSRGGGVDFDAVTADQPKVAATIYPHSGEWHVRFRPPDQKPIVVNRGRRSREQ